MTIAEHAAALIVEYDTKYTRCGPYHTPIKGVVYLNYSSSKVVNQLNIATQRRSGTWKRASVTSIPIAKVNPSTGVTYTVEEADQLVIAIEQIYDGLWIVMDIDDPNYGVDWDNQVIVIEPVNDLLWGAPPICI